MTMKIVLMTKIIIYDGFNYSKRDNNCNVDNNEIQNKIRKNNPDNTNINISKKYTDNNKDYNHNDDFNNKG